jgi:hypothetical protein
MAALPNADTPAVEAPKLVEAAMPPNEQATRPIAPPLPPSVAQPAPADAHANRFALLAASVAIAAAVGAMTGALAVSGFTAAAPVPAPVVQTGDDTRAWAASIAQLRTDLAALKTSFEGGTKAANGQFTKMSERFDRVERAQAEPAAKIAKAVDAIERLEKRIDTASSSKETTGSVAQTQPPAATPVSVQSPQQPVVEGWVVRDVYRGAAVIQGRRFGMMEVEPGDTIPGVGRVEAIRKQEGRWVVVTSKGVIGSPSAPSR